MNFSELLLLLLAGLLAAVPARGAGVGRSVRSPSDMIACVSPCEATYSTCIGRCVATPGNSYDCQESCLDTVLSCDCSCKSRLRLLKSSTAVTALGKESGLLRIIEAPKSLMSSDGYNKKFTCYNSRILEMDDCVKKCEVTFSDSCLTNCYESVMSALCRCGTEGGSSGDSSGDSPGDSSGDSPGDSPSGSASLKAGGFLFLVVALFNSLLKQGN